MNRITIDDVYKHCLRQIDRYSNHDNLFYQEHKLVKEVIEQLKEYQQLEEQGLLLKLPCKVGDVIYVNGVLGVGESEEYKVIRVYYQSNTLMKRSEFCVEALLVSDPRNSIEFYDKEIGKSIFLTKEEAEAKLKEMRGEEE